MTKKEEGWGEEKDTYCKISKISPGTYLIFSKAVLEGLIYGGKSAFQNTLAQPYRHLYLEGRFNGGFFTLPVWGSYMDGLIFGILRYFIFHRSHSALVSHSFAAHPSYMPSFLEHIFYGVLKEKQTTCTCYLKNLQGMQCPVQWSISLSHSCMAGVSLLIPSLLINCTLSSLAKSPNQCCKLSLKSPEGSG